MSYDSGIVFVLLVSRVVLGFSLLVGFGGTLVEAPNGRPLLSY